MSRKFTETEISSRHTSIATAGICPDCEVTLVLAEDISWPHEDCPDCGAHYLADYHPGYRRMIQSFPIPNDICRDMLISVLYDAPLEDSKHETP